jgi:hypothetical protein
MVGTKIACLRIYLSYLAENPHFIRGEAIMTEETGLPENNN